MKTTRIPIIALCLLLSGCNLRDLLFWQSESEADPGDSSRIVDPIIASAPLTVIRDGAAANAEFLAFRVVGGDWQVAEGVAGKYSLPIGDSTQPYDIVVVCVDAADLARGYVVQQRETDPVSFQCPARSPAASTTITVSGQVVGTFQTATVTLGKQSLAVSPAQPGFSIATRPGIYDVIVMGDTGDGIRRIMVVEDVDLTTAQTIPDINFDQAQPAEVRTVEFAQRLFNQVLDKDYAGGEASILARATQLQTGLDTDYNGKFSYFGAGSHAVSASLTARDSKLSGEERVVTRTLLHPKDVSFPLLPAKLSAPLFNGSDRLDLSWTHYDNKGMLHETLAYRFEIGQTGHYLWQIWRRDDYFPNDGGTHSYVFPDLSRLTGWDPAWTPMLSTADHWELNAYSVGTAVYWHLVLKVFNYLFNGELDRYLETVDWDLLGADSLEIVRASRSGT